MNLGPELTVRGLVVRAVDVPMNRPLITGGGEVGSVAVSPTRHWLEYVDWADPILEKPLEIEDGYALAPDAAGIGISWDEGAVQRYSVGEP